MGRESEDEGSRGRPHTGTICLPFTLCTVLCCVGHPNGYKSPLSKQALSIIPEVTQVACSLAYFSKRLETVSSCRRRAVMLTIWENGCDDWLTQAFLIFFFSGTCWARNMREYTEKKETCGTICLKYLLFIFNFFFWVRSFSLFQRHWDGTAFLVWGAQKPWSWWSLWQKALTSVGCRFHPVGLPAQAAEVMVWHCSLCLFLGHVTKYRK